METKTYCIIDDEPEVLEGFCANLEQLGKVVGFSSAEAALKAFDEGFSPSVTLVDLKMPNIGGIDFVEAYRKKNYGGAVIIASGNASKTDLARALNLRTAGYLEKPFTAVALREAVRGAEVAAEKAVVCARNHAPTVTESLLECYSHLAKIYNDWIALIENDAKDSGRPFLSKLSDKEAYVHLKHCAEELWHTIEMLGG